MDNRVFNVNGKGKAMLTEVLRLALWHHSGCMGNGSDCTAKGYMVDPNKGLILLWTLDDKDQRHQKFIAPLRADALAENVYAWLASEEAAQIPLTGTWDDDCDHDGHNSKGWRVFCEDWGHVGAAEWKGIVAITPAYMWHGK